MRIIHLAYLVVLISVHINAQSPNSDISYLSTHTISQYDTSILEVPTYLGEDVADKEYVYEEKFMTRAPYTAIRPFRIELCRENIANCNMISDVLIPASYLSLHVISEDKVNEFPDSLVSWQRVKTLELIEDSNQYVKIEVPDFFAMDKIVYVAQFVSQIHSLIYEDVIDYYTRTFSDADKRFDIHQFQFEMGYLEKPVANYPLIITQELVDYFALDLEAINQPTKTCETLAFPIPVYDTLLVEVAIYTGDNPETTKHIKSKQFTTRPAEKILVKHPKKSGLTDSIYVVETRRKARTITLPLIKEKKVKLFAPEHIELDTLKVFEPVVKAETEWIEAICEPSRDLINTIYAHIYMRKLTVEPIPQLSMQEKLDEIYRFQEAMGYNHAYSYDETGQRIILYQTLKDLKIY